MIGTLKLVPRQPIAREGETLFDELRRLDASLGTGVNNNDRAIKLITACLRKGMTTIPEVAGVLKHLGFKTGHVAMIMKKSAGSAPAKPWKLDGSGGYELHA